MLHAKVPNARIMTFNYLSKWFDWRGDTVKTRKAICAQQLKSAVANKRDEVGCPWKVDERQLMGRKEPHTRDRPIIFIGHSFGGIVIEQVFIPRNSSCPNIADKTIGDSGLEYTASTHVRKARTQFSYLDSWSCFLGHTLPWNTSRNSTLSTCVH